MADGTPENLRDRRFIPAFIDFIAAGIVGVAIHQVVHAEYSSGIALVVISIVLFFVAFFWGTLTTRLPLPPRMSQTALNTALDFRWWVGISLLIAAYFVVFPFLGSHQTAVPSSVLLTANYNYDGTPLGMVWQSANLRTVSAAMPQGAENRIFSFTVFGKNLASQEILLQEGYIISSVTGERIPMRVNTNPFPDMNIDEAAPVPANAFINFTAPFGSSGITQAEFMQKRQGFSVIIKYDNKTIRHELTREAVLAMVSGLYPESVPHITKRQP
jgi:hypothetical protein